VAYTTFEPDMRVARTEGLAAAKAAGIAIRKNISDPFAMFLPLAKQIAIIMGCGVRVLWYLVRWIWG